VKKKFLNLLIVLSLLVTLGGVFAEPTHAAPAECYWVGDGGNWSDATNHWATSSGGAPGAGNLPDSSSNVHFDANSFTVGGQTVTIDATAYCKDMDWTGATDNPTLAAGTNPILVHGSTILIAGMSLSATGGSYFFHLLGTGNFTSGGLDIPRGVLLPSTGVPNITLLDNLTVPYYLLVFQKGTLNTNGKIVTVSGVILAGADAKTLTMGASNINTTGVTGWKYDGSNLTVTANTATFIITGTGDLAGGSVDYNGADFNLNGTAHTVSGSFTCEAITTPPATTQT